MQRYFKILVVIFCFSAFTARANLPNFADLIERSSPAVVKINVAIAPKMSGNLQAPNGQPIPEIFRQFLDPRLQNGQPPRTQESTGSGFFISSDGYVITNHHVIDDASEITVELVDRRQYVANVVGVDPRSDLALLKIEETGLPFLKVAREPSLRVGDWVVAIGSPFGLEFSASAGIVSAKGRSIRNDSGEDYVPFIQTDVAINPGNSGGPLFNLAGEVVGVNSQIYSRSGGSIGLSFAIPASVVTNVVSQLKEKGTVDRGWLGVEIQGIDRDLASSFGLDRPRGALVRGVMPNSPAEKGGLKAGDVILGMNGKPVNASSDLPHLVGAQKPGEKVEFELIRKGKIRTLKLKIGSLDKGNVAENTAPGSGKHGRKSVIGLAVERVPDQLANQLGITSGVMVNEVVSATPADLAGLKPGDVIVDIAFNEVTGVKSFKKIVKGLNKNKLYPVRFIRDGRAIYRTIKIQ